MAYVGSYPFLAYARERGVDYGDVIDVAEWMRQEVVYSYAPPVMWEKVRFNNSVARGKNACSRLAGATGESPAMHATRILSILRRLPARHWCWPT